MSTLLGSFPVAQYNGVPQAAATGLCTRSIQPPFCVPLKIQWNVYWQALGNPSTLGVDVNLEGTTPNAAQLDVIRSVKIDNTFSTCPILIYFPDTQDVITCPPQTVVTQQVNTNGKKLTVYASGLTAGFIPLTQIFLFNVALQPSVNEAIQNTYPQFKGSPLIQRSNILTPGYSPPALQDQFNATSINLFNLGTTVRLWNTPLAVNTNNVMTLGLVSATWTSLQTTPPVRVEVVMESLTSGTLMPFVIQLFGGTAVAFQAAPVLSGMALKLDLTETWQLRVTTNQDGTQARLYLNTAYCLNTF